MAVVSDCLVDRDQLTFGDERVARLNSCIAEPGEAELATLEA